MSFTSNEEDKHLRKYRLRKQPTFGEVVIWALAKRRLSSEPRNSILTTCHYPDLGSASDWLEFSFNQSKALPRSGYGAPLYLHYCNQFYGYLEKHLLHALWIMTMSLSMILDSPHLHNQHLPSSPFAANVNFEVSTKANLIFLTFLMAFSQSFC